jgi:hypothetical protein
MSSKKKTVKKKLKKALRGVPPQARAQVLKVASQKLLSQSSAMRTPPQAAPASATDAYALARWSAELAVAVREPALRYHHDPAIRTHWRGIYAATDAYYTQQSVLERLQAPMELRKSLDAAWPRPQSHQIPCVAIWPAHYAA